MSQASKSGQSAASRQCKLLGYEPIPESEMNLRIMRLMDEQYLLHPDKGPRRMHSSKGSGGP